MSGEYGIHITDRRIHIGGDTRIKIKCNREISKFQRLFRGNSGCVYAQSSDISLLEQPSVDVKCNPNTWIAITFTRVMNKSLKFVRRHLSGVSSRAAYRMKAVPLIRTRLHMWLIPQNGINRIPAEMCHTTEERKVSENVMTLLDEAINFHQSDHIADARENLRQVFRSHLKR
ncbi:hypothetical protein OS493_035837 [Desmophyllum pertusum]|uniref:Uncharacterized protein n=1 Tax=Desmophyllum pertusum TaxID=174260 RepID=A0A9X0CDT5_9CNID|nr:hypothetical protein OS493_035837 [Desmophyllum pertusum]